MRILVRLLCLLFLCVGCGKNDPEESYKPIEPIIPIEPEYSYDYFEFSGFHVKDTAGFQKETITLYSTNDTTWIFGIKEQKFWFGLFNSRTKEQISEWSGVTALPLDRKYTIQRDPFKLSSGYIFFLVASKLYPFLLKDNEIICLNESGIVYDQDITVKEVDDNILICNSNSLSNLYNSEGREIINSILILEKQDDGKYFLSGFKQKRTWLGIYKEGRLEEEYIGEQDYNRNIELYTGYGNYEDYYVDALVFNDRRCFIETNWGYVFAPAYGEHRSVIVDIFLCKDGKMKRIDAPNQYLTLSNWYEDSFLVYDPGSSIGSTIRYTIYSPEGEKILEQNKNRETNVDPFETSDTPLVPVSYTEYIWNDNWSGDLRIRRYKLGSSAIEPVWSNFIKNISNAKATWTLLDKQSNNWYYQIDILNYDGTKEKINFFVDIETGKLTYND